MPCKTRDPVDIDTPPTYLRICAYESRSLPYDITHFSDRFLCTQSNMKLPPISVAFVTLAAVCVGISSASLQREDINFDFGWRFDFGDYPIKCDVNANFPRDLNKVECMGLSKNSASNADECRDACCSDVSCTIWQFDVGNPQDGCWIGQSDDCNHPNTAWVGGGRNTPGPIPPDPGGPSSKDFDDSSWELVDLPHDGIIGGTYDQSAVKSHAYLPLNTTWYRKHFNLPTEWKGKSIWVYFEGAFRASTVYLNGQQLLYHDSGYTSFSARLDNASNVMYGNGQGNENVIAVQVNVNGGYTGWWYEGGGIYRHNHLVSANPVHIVVNSVYGASQVVGTIRDHDPKNPSKGQYADVEFYPMVEVVNDGSAQTSVMVKFDLIDDSGAKKGTVTSQKMTVDSGKVVVVNTTIPKVSSIELWSLARPYLYKLQISLMIASDSSLIDNMTYSIGARHTRWDPNTGFYLNGKHFTWRGFNNHNDFTGIGVAVPDRVNLFRGQMMRAVGANSWRMSHNPPFPVMLDILDNIGVIVWDENRNFGPNAVWIQDQKDMVRRDRNHPSIMAWSFCNEAGCGSGDKGGAAGNFSIVSKQEDPFRPVTANMFFTTNDDLANTIEVQGFSHIDGKYFDEYHQKVPNKAVIGSECCSCVTQRGEDVADSANKILSNFNANCNKAQTEAQLNRKFVAGCMVWTLFDYYGEPAEGGWPHVSSSYGSIDLAGFAKASAYWYRSWWYYSAKMNDSDSGYDIPVNPPPLVNPYAAASEENPMDGYMVHIVQKWEPLPNMPNRTIQVYTNAPMAELTVNGKSQGSVKVDWQGWAEWDKVPFSAGKIVATALDSQNQVKATHTVETAGTPAKVVANIDVPSMATGTGKSLVLDGQDAGMVSAAIVDAQGKVVPSASHNVTFSIVSGPGRIIGVGNGNPMCHEPNKASWRSAYHGLARVIVQVTQNAASSLHHRKRMIQIDREGGVCTHIVPPEDTSPRDDAIVVQASVEGLGSSTVSIPVSTDIDADGVVAVAKKSVIN